MNEDLVKSDKLTISFSGGRTSAVMTKMLLDIYRDKKEIIITFANTGCEHPDTLRFVDACDKNWNFNTVWLEAAVTQEDNIGIRSKVVTYETCSKNGEPFRDYIQKYGIPNRNYPQCTSRLKTEPMRHYLKTQGFFRGKKLNHDTAIGIRADEMDRVSSKRDEEKFVYPLVEWGWTKQMVIDYMKQFPWDLNIPEHLGNCTWCWKKSHRKHLTLAQDYPEVFNFPKKMEEEFATHKSSLCKDGRRLFFRGHKSVDEILQEAQEGKFKRFDDPRFNVQIDWDENLDRGSGCSESCDVYGEYHE